MIAQDGGYSAAMAIFVKCWPARPGSFKQPGKKPALQTTITEFASSSKTILDVSKEKRAFNGRVFLY
jgi:hypothetical protein